MPRRLVRALITALVVAVAAVGAPGTATAADPTGSISGTVTVPAGYEPGAQVVAHAVTGGATFIAVTDADGRYTIDSLPAGSYVVEFQARDRRLVLQYWQLAEAWGTSTRVPVNGSAVTGIDAHLYVGATLSGTIHTNSDCDLTKVQVIAGAGDGKVLPTPVVQPDGRWSVSGLAAGADYIVMFDGRYAGLDGYANWPPVVNWRTDPGRFPVPAGSTRTGIDVTLNGPTYGCVAPGPYVRQLYQDLLGRDGEWTAVNDWTQALVWGRTTVPGVANAFTTSDEFRTRLLDDTYREYLGRGTDPSGLAYWLGQMRTGRPIEAVHAGFIASDEFYATSGGTPEGWVRGLYETVLDREPSQPEVDWWVAAIGRGMNRGTVAGGFLYSTEHLTTVVDGYYQWLLHRGIDPVGARDWVRLIQQGHRDEEIIAGLVSSTEYRLNVPR